MMVGRPSSPLSSSCAGTTAYAVLWLLCATFILLSSSLCDAAFNFKASEAPDLEQYFQPQQQGWLGADVSMSLPLNNSVYVWLWGDTLVGTLQKSPTTNATVRKVTAMPHSSLAFVNMAAGGDKTPKFWIRPGPDPMGVFRPQNPTNASEYYWIPGGTMSPHYQQLVVTAQVIVNTQQAPGFAQIGTDVIVVSNPHDDPSQWQYKTSRIPTSSGSLSWNSGIAFDNATGDFYLIGLENLNAYLARIPEGDLLKFNWGNAQYWSVGKQWSSNANSLLSIYPSVYTEGTLQWHPFMQQWFVVLCQAYQKNIEIAYAPSLTGPWTQQTVYTIPAPYTNGTYTTYAAKSHPEYTTKQNEIVFTYNINAPDENVVFRDLTTYHPKFVRLEVAKA